MACFIWLCWQQCLEKILYVTKENKHKFESVLLAWGRSSVPRLFYDNWKNCMAGNLFILGLLFLGFYQGVKRKNIILETGYF